MQIHPRHALFFHWDYVTDNNFIRSNSLFFLFVFVFFSIRVFTVHRTAGEREGYFFNSSLPLTTTSQTLRPGNYCRQLTSAQRWQPNSNREPLVSERKSLAFKLSKPLSFCLCIKTFARALSLAISLKLIVQLSSIFLSNMW